LSRISWHEVQNGIVLVASIAVLKPPQATTPPMPPTTSSVSAEYFRLGLRRVCQILASHPGEEALSSLRSADIAFSMRRRACLGV
jgi:hypothetical protein